MSRLPEKERKLRDEMFAKGLLWCVDCKQFLPIREFHKRNVQRNNYGHAFHCKDSEKRRMAGYGHNKQQLEAQRRKKRNLILMAGGNCCRCGYDEFMSCLVFHHVDPTEKEHSGNLSASLSFEVAAKEIDKCAVLCSNCHASYHASEWEAEFVKRDGVGYRIGKFL